LGAGVSALKGTEDALMITLRETTDALRAQLEKYPGLTFGWTGEAAVNADMRRVSAERGRVASKRRRQCRPHNPARSARDQCIHVFLHSLLVFI
jgi:hypothetical protein